MWGSKEDGDVEGKVKRITYMLLEQKSLAVMVDNQEGVYPRSGRWLLGQAWLWARLYFQSL